MSSVAWYPADRGIFASTSYDMILKVWDAEALAEASSVHLGSKVNFASFGKRMQTYDILAGKRLSH